MIFHPTTHDTFFFISGLVRTLFWALLVWRLSKYDSKLGLVAAALAVAASLFYAGFNSGYWNATTTDLHVVTAATIAIPALLFIFSVRDD